jgi:hypothetical protein
MPQAVKARVLELNPKEIRFGIVGMVTFVQFRNVETDEANR